MEDRRAALDAKEEEKKRKQEGLAKPREIVHPDHRPVKYNPTPIGITQALRAVDAPILSEDPIIPPNPVASPSKPVIDKRKQILQRVNQRYSMDFDADAESAESRPADSAKKDEVESMKLE
uniref:Uncharacterized protein n=1 Tax=Ciona savignyi TaxID=51511 RepID=H2ZNH0_CIOSA